jgi:hypothetical protein
MTMFRLSSEAAEAVSPERALTRLKGGDELVRGDLLGGGVAEHKVWNNSGQRSTP